MPDSIERIGAQQSNVVDRAAQSADKAVEATRRATDALLDNVAHKVEDVRSAVSPALDRASAPLDAVTRYTTQQPLKALAAAILLGLVIGRIL